MIKTTNHICIFFHVGKQLNTQNLLSAVGQWFDTDLFGIANPEGDMMEPDKLPLCGLKGKSTTEELQGLKNKQYGTFQ